MKLVSVIIPLYKSEPYIAQTLDSVLAQTHTNIEVICVDDCSPDKTAKIVKDYAKRDARITYVAHTKNKGAPAYGRNTGLGLAKGEFVTFLDHDDTFLPEKLAELIAVLEKEQVDFVCSNCLLVNDATGKTDMLAWSGVKGDPRTGFARRLLQDNFVPPNSTLIRRSVFLEVKGFDTTLKGVDDFDLWYRIARQFPATVHNKPLATWRYLNKNSISADQVKMLTDEIRFYRKILTLKDVTAYEEKVALEQIKRDTRRIGNQLLLQGKYEDALKYYGAAEATRLVFFVTQVPGLVRFLYQLRTKRHSTFQPLYLDFTNE